jgi:hypothetical protein
LIEYFGIGSGASWLLALTSCGSLIPPRALDGLDYAADGKTAFRINHQKLAARLEFLNFEQEFHYVFELRGVRSIWSNLFLNDFSGVGIGDLYTYEIAAEDDSHLQLAFLFASGAMIAVQFRKACVPPCPYQPEVWVRRNRLEAVRLLLLEVWRLSGFMKDFPVPQFLSALQSLPPLRELDAVSGPA